MTFSPRISEQAAWSAASYFLRGLGNALSHILLARLLLPEGYGIYSVALLVSTTMWIAVDFGVSSFGVREVAKASDSDKRLRIMSELLSLRLVFAVVAIFLMFFVLEFLPIQNHWKHPIFLSGGVFVLTYSLCPDWYFRGLGQFKKITMGGMISFSFFFPAIILLIKTPDDLNLACFLWGLSLFPTTLFLLAKAFHGLPGLIHFVKNDLSCKIFSNIKKAKYFFLIAVFDNLYTVFPTLVLSSLLTVQDVGYFSAAYRVYLLLKSLALPLSVVFYRLLSQVYAESDLESFEAQRKKWGKLTVIFFLPISLILWAWGDDVFVLLFGRSFESAAWVFPYFALPLFLSAMRLVLSVSLTACGHQRYLAFTTLFMALFSLAASYIFIQFAGFVGAVLVVCTGEVIYYSALVFLSRKHFLNPIKAVP